MGAKQGKPMKITIHDREFTLGRIVGCGSFGKVFAVSTEEDGKHLAMKTFNKAELIRRQRVALVLQERQLLATISHPFVVNLCYASQTETDLRMVLDLMLGGDLRFHLKKRRFIGFSEPQVIFFAAQILLSIEHVHKHDIVHRDIKPDNCLLDERGYCHLNDFGIATRLVNNKTRSAAGTLPYMAPEVLACKSYGREADMWAFGCLVFELIAGRVPFPCAGARSTSFSSHTYRKREFKTRLRSLQHLRIPFTVDFSPNAVNLIKQLIVTSPHKRLSATEARSHPFFETIDWERLLKKDLDEVPFVPNQKKANVDGVHDLMEQLVIKKKKQTALSAAEQAMFAAWNWVRSDETEPELPMVPDFTHKLEQKKRITALDHLMDEPPFPFRSNLANPLAQTLPNLPTVRDLGLSNKSQLNSSMGWISISSGLSQGMDGFSDSDASDTESTDSIDEAVERLQSMIVANSYGSLNNNTSTLERHKGRTGKGSSLKNSDGGSIDNISRKDTRSFPFHDADMRKHPINGKLTNPLTASANDISELLQNKQLSSLGDSVMKKERNRKANKKQKSPSKRSAKSSTGTLKQSTSAQPFSPPSRNHHRIHQSCSSEFESESRSRRKKRMKKKSRSTRDMSNGTSHGRSKAYTESKLEIPPDFLVKSKKTSSELTATR